MSANNKSIQQRNDVSIKDDKQYSRVVDTAQTQGNDDYEQEEIDEVDVVNNGDVQTLDGDIGGHGNSSSTHKYYRDDDVVYDQNNSLYNKVGTQSTTDRNRLGNAQEYNEDAFDTKKTDLSVKKGHVNQSVKSKDK